MNTFFPKKRIGVTFAVTLVLFFCLTLQTPLMSYGMDGMDCKTQITCAACGCVINSFSTPLSLSPFFIELSQSADFRIPEVICIQKPQIHPPR
ncbi:MAG: hypothetical protein IH886_09985 [Nitrospinae bacterium]|nr:hypothetical protein [Nitrospinota bacterium]